MSEFIKRGGDYVESRFKQIKCPNCLNYMMVEAKENGKASVGKGEGNTDLKAVVK